MIPLRYTVQDAKRWAQFSDDWNPVHFSLSRARERGVSRLTVHGMRALLDMKGALAVDDRFRWLKCTVRLRQPLWCDETYLLSSVPHEGQSLQVTAMHDEQIRVSCRLTGQKNAPDDDGEQIDTLQDDELKSLRRAFLALMPGARRWHFLDGLLFRQLINERTLMAQPAIALKLTGSPTLGELFERCQIVQTHQETVFDSRLQTSLVADEEMTLALKLLPTLVTGSPEAGLVAQVGIAASVAGQRMTNRLTLKIALRKP